MIADIIGMFMVIFDSSPFLNFTSGVFKLTLLGIQRSSVKFGINKNSLNVLEISFNIFAILFLLPIIISDYNITLHNFFQVIFSSNQKRLEF